MFFFTKSVKAGILTKISISFPLIKTLILLYYADDILLSVWSLVRNVLHAGSQILTKYRDKTGSDRTFGVEKIQCNITTIFKEEHCEVAGVQFNKATYQHIDCMSPHQRAPIFPTMAIFPNHRTPPALPVSKLNIWYCKGALQF